MSYEASLKRKLDWESALSTACRDGQREGREEGREEERAKVEAEMCAIALKLKEKGVPTIDIAEVTGLSVDEVEQLK